MNNLESNSGGCRVSGPVAWIRGTLVEMRTKKREHLVRIGSDKEHEDDVPLYLHPDPVRAALEDRVNALVEALKKSVQHIEDMTTLYAHDLCDQDQVKSASQRIQESGGTLYASCVVTQSGRAALKAAGVLL